MDAESGSRALGAAHDLVELLHLALGAALRTAREVGSASFEEIDRLGREIHRLRREAERLEVAIEHFVKREVPSYVPRKDLQ